MSQTPSLKVQLIIYHQLQRKVVRARDRVRRCPIWLFKNNLAKAEEEAAVVAHSLMMLIPASHDEAVYAILSPRSSSGASL